MNQPNMYSYRQGHRRKARDKKLVAMRLILRTLKHLLLRILSGMDFLAVVNLKPNLPGPQSQGTEGGHHIGDQFYSNILAGSQQFPSTCIKHKTFCTVTLMNTSFLGAHKLIIRSKNCPRKPNDII